MLRCIAHVAVLSLWGGVFGLILGLFWPLVTKPRLRTEWEECKRKHGFWKAWAIQSGKMVLACVLTILLLGLFQCCRGEAPSETPTAPPPVMPTATPTDTPTLTQQPLLSPTATAPATPSPAAIESRPSPTLMPSSEVITYTV